MCLLSHHEWRPHQTSGGGQAASPTTTSGIIYAEILRWTPVEWRTIDVLRSDDLIDRFIIVDTSVSVFPAISQGVANLPAGMGRPSLATLPLGLRYEGTVDPAGRPLMTASSGHYAPISVSSRLHQTADGLLGQVTSDGFFAFELRLPSGRYIDLKASKLFMSLKTHAEIDRRTSFSASNGLLAVCSPRHVRIYDLYQAGSSLISKINNGLSRVALEEVIWISEDEIALLASDGIILVNVHDGSQVPIKLAIPSVGEAEAPPPCYSNMIICPQQTCLLLLDQRGHRMVRLALARPVDTCGRTSKLMAYIREGRQLHLLAIPPSLFSSDRHSSATSLRDQTVVWKSLDVPFQAYLQGSINGPIRMACQDGRGQWMLLAGRTGFCVFSHFGNGSGDWMLFSDAHEGAAFAVKLATWIRLEDSGQQAPPVLVLYVWFEERKEHEFLLFVVSKSKRFLSLHWAAHRQKVEGRIIALQDCSQGVLAILLEDAVLQLVQLTVKETLSSSLRMVLLLRASLDGILTMGDLTKIVKLTYLRDHALLLVKNEDGLLGVAMPTSPLESAGHQQDIGAKVLIKGRICDFVVWPTGNGQHWIVAQVGQRIHCREVPLATGRFFEFEGSLPSFYPLHAYGLHLKVELTGSGSVEHAHRLSVAGTEAFVVHLLHYLISLDGDDEGEHFYQMARSLDRRDIGAFLLVMELLLERILAVAPVPQQAKLYRRLKYRLQDLVTDREYRQILFHLLRRIEAEDARRVMALLGPFDELFERALRGEELLAAWSFYRIAATGAVREREECRLPARGQSLVKKALEGRQLAILRGVLRLAEELHMRDLGPALDELKTLSGEKRDWPTLEMLYSEGLLPLHQIRVSPDASVEHTLANCMLHAELGRPREFVFIHCLSVGRDDLLRSLATAPDSSLDGHSRVTRLLQELSLPIESALWSCIVEGRGYNEAILSSTIGLDDLTSIIRNKYDIL